MKRLFKTFSIFCLACVLLSACSQQPPDTAPVQEPVQDGAVEEAPVYVYLTRHGQTLTNQTGRLPRKLRASSSPRVRHPDIWRSYLSKT